MTKPSKEFIAMLTGVMNGEKWRRALSFSAPWNYTGSYIYMDSSEVCVRYKGRRCSFYLEQGELTATDWEKTNE